MYYVKSRNSRTYQASINGVQVVIPPISSKNWLPCDEETYKLLCEYPTIKGLIDCGAIIATDTEPDDIKNSPETLMQTRKELEDQVASLKAQLEKSDASAVQKELEEVKAEALEAIAGKDKEIEALKAQLAAATNAESNKGKGK